MSLTDEELAASLLPPGSTPGERAIEHAMRADIDLAAVGNLWDPATCPAAALPFLAWGLAVPYWDAAWSEVQKRTAVAGAIPFHRIKGTRAAVRQVLDRFEPLLQLVEWWEVTPPRDAHTFEVRAPADLIPASFLTAEVAAAIIRDVAAAKPLRSHFTFVQSLEAEALAWLAAGAMTATFLRSEHDAAHDPDPIWGARLQTEEGEPLQGGAGEFLENI